MRIEIFHFIFTHYIQRTCKDRKAFTDIHIRVSSHQNKPLAELKREIPISSYQHNVLVFLRKKDLKLISQ